MLIYESDRFGADGYIQIIEGFEVLYPPRHFHRSFELLYMQKGEAVVFVDGRDLRLLPGDFLLLFPNRLHAYRADGPARAKLAIFSPDYVSAFTAKYPRLSLEEPVFRLSDEFRDFVLTRLVRSSGEFAVMACLYAILAQLLEDGRMTDRPRAPDELPGYRLMATIEARYREPLSLRQLARELGYSYKYLSACFNRQFGLSFPEMLNAYRVSCAASLLRSGGRITDTAFECGYGSLRSFNRNFRLLMQKTPSAYRNSPYPHEECGRY